MVGLELIRNILEKNPLLFVSVADKICAMVAALLQDQNPDMKNAAASFASALALSLDTRVGKYLRETISSLTTNLQHQHSKVRKSSLKALKDVCVCKGAETHTDLCLRQLIFNANDRTLDVRKVLYFDVLPHWLTEMELTCLRVFEKDFLQLLLNGMADEQSEISQKCI